MCNIGLRPSHAVQQGLECTMGYNHGITRPGFYFGCSKWEWVLADFFESVPPHNQFKVENFRNIFQNGWVLGVIVPIVPTK